MHIHHHVMRHAHKAHHHLHRVSGAALTRLAKSHPIVVMSLALIGGVAIVKKVTDKPSGVQGAAS